MKVVWTVMVVAAVVMMAVMGTGIWAGETQPGVGSVSGSVVLKDGTAAGGARIRVMKGSADHSQEPVQVMTQDANADGTFKVEGLAAGSYLVKFESGGQVGSKSATVKAGKDTAVGKVTLKAPGNTGQKVEPKEGGGKKG